MRTMQRLAEFPANLKAYRFHGVNLSYRDGDKESVGDCPFCGREGKFSVNAESGKWQCFVCREGTEKGGGNQLTFIRLLWKKGDEATNDYEELARERGLLYPDTLIRWGIVRSIIDRTWLVPGFNSEGKLCQLYRYTRDPASKRMCLLATPELGHQLLGCFPLSTGKSNLFICEGVWDAMALWESMRLAKVGSDKDLIQTASEELSLLKDTDIIATPACTVFPDSWCSIAKDKHTSLLFDSDHPRKHPQTGKPIEPAGYAGMRRSAQILAKASEPPETISYLRWGENGYDPERKSGFDVRDYLLSLPDSRDNVKPRLTALQSLLSLIQPVPEDWIGGRTKATAKKGGVQIETIPCQDWKGLVLDWRKGMTWTQGLDLGLSVMLACVISTRAVGEQLWIKLIGPASCGKTTLCEALSVARKWVVPKDTLSGLTSGYQVDAEGSENLSLVLKLRDKTLVINDGDTILQLPNRDQLLSQLRTFYSRNIRSQYGNKMSTDHENVSTSLILCGTDSLRFLDSSELGERFITIYVMDEIDEDLEDAVLLRVGNRTMRGMAYETNGKPESLDDPDLIRAKQRTGGYVNYLRENSKEILSSITMGEDRLRQCMLYGKFAAYMRARPSKKQEESAQREFAARLVSQLTRLSICLSGVMNRSEVDDEVMKRVHQVTLHTAKGRTLAIGKLLYNAGLAGMDTASIAFHTGYPEDKERILLRFLHRIGAVEVYKPSNGVTVRSAGRWRLTDRVRKLFREVYGS